jgi:nitroreductase
MTKSLLNSIANRRSQLAYSPENIEESDLNLLFEAARWAPSSYNEQPWRFYFVTRTNIDKFNKMLSLLAPANSEWASNSSLLIFTTAKTHLSLNGNLNSFALHDTGLATANILLQAESMGLVTHIMGGFNSQETSKILGLDNEYVPVSVIAVGYKGNDSLLSESNKKRANSKRTRKGLSEIAFRL